MWRGLWPIGLAVLSHAHREAQEFGLYGVELFFALSGFLIGGILYRCIPEKGPWAFAALLNFWKRRWWRTLPAYYLFLVVATAISLWSYSIYLCHHMVFLAVVSWFGADWEQLWEKLVPKALGMGLVLLISRYVYRHYEAPMTRLRPAECVDGFADGASRRGLS